jgi:hypothetical protein
MPDNNDFKGWKRVQWLEITQLGLIVLFSALLRFLPSVITPWMTESLIDIKARLSKIEPVYAEIHSRKTGDLCIRGFAEIVRGKGHFAYISRNYCSMTREKGTYSYFKLGERIRVTNLEYIGDPSIAIPIKGDFEPTGENVIVQLSEAAAKSIGFDIKRGITTVILESAEQNDGSNVIQKSQNK